MRHVPISSSFQGGRLLTRNIKATEPVGSLYDAINAKSAPLRSPIPRVEQSTSRLKATGRGIKGAIDSVGLRVHSQGFNKMKSHIQFITTPTADTPGTALLLHFDDKRYLIGNIHEGLQRAGLQVGAKFFKTKDFFLTGRTEWRTTGGLMGMILTLADAAIASATSKAETARIKLEHRKRREEEENKRRKKKTSEKADSDTLQPSTPTEEATVEKDSTVTMHGGPNLTHTIATARSFIFRKGTPIRVNEHHEDDWARRTEQGWEPTWSDNRILVWAMPIVPFDANHWSETPKPEAPQKQSVGMFMKGDCPMASDMDQLSEPSTGLEEQAERDQKIRDFVVKEMFSSEWRFDTLVEMPLHQVRPPAGMFIRNPETHKLERFTGPKPDGNTPIPNINVLVRQPWPGALIDHLPPTKPSKVAMSYIFRNHKQRGKFKPATAKELKVTPGPLWAALAAGSEVQSTDGKTITPDMVLEPSKEGSGVAVVDLPSRDYVQGLINRPEWKVEKVMTGVCAIVWILGPGVADDEKLSAFISDHPELKHVVSSPDECPNYLSMTSAATSAIRHHQMDPARYPIPVHSNVIPQHADQPTRGPEKSSTSRLLARRGLRLELEPSFKVTETTVVPHLNTAVIVKETPQEVLKLSQAAQRDIYSTPAQAESANQDLPSPDAEVICLGTGSALPSQHRNVSATLLRVPGSGSYLFDCGENTLGQLKRVYTEEQLEEVLQDLKVIWVSHLHADHHLGIASVIKSWYEKVHGKDPSRRPRPSLTEALLAPGKFLEDGKQLFIVGHRNMVRWLREYSSAEDYGYNQLVPLESYPTDFKDPDHCMLQWDGLDMGFNTSEDSRVKSAMRQATGLSNLVTTYVNHCHGAQAISVTFPTGFKFSYSGDCRPSRNFAIIGKGSTVLVHEATFDDELEGDAMAKKHCTTSEAIGVGAAMGARRVILTHFSQRYQKIPSSGSMDSIRVRLEDTDPNEDVDQPIEGVEPSTPAQAPASNFTNESSEALAPKSPEEQVLDQQHQSALTTDSTFSSLMSLASFMKTPSRPTVPVDMKLAVAFDYMRVKVRDIIHLEKFNPAMRELYKEVEEAEGDEKAKRAAKEAFSDAENDIRDVQPVGNGKMTQVEKVRKGQVKAAKRKKKNAERWEREKAEGDKAVTEEAPASDQLMVFEPPVQEQKGKRAVH